MNVRSCFGTDLLKNILLVEDRIWFEYDYLHGPSSRVKLSE